MASENELKKVEAAITAWPDFPEKGIVFRDIHPVMANHELR